MDHFKSDTNNILEILKKSPHGMSITEIARAIQKNKNSAGRYLDTLQVSGRIEMRRYGKAKVFTIANRIPQDTLLNYSREFILLIDKENRILHVNNFFLDLINLPRGAILGKNISFISGLSSSTQIILDSIQSCIKTGIPECEIHVENDIKEAYFLRVIPMVFNDGTKGTGISMENITDRKNAVFLEQKYNALLNLLTDGICQAILIAENERIVFANKPAEELFDFSCEGLPLFYLTERIISEDRDHIRKLFSEFQDSMKKPLEITFSMNGTSGVRKRVKGRFILLRESLKESFLLIMIDISP
jgi:PAS domain-containing protein